MINRERLLVIVGPTASGKSALAMELAERLDGEIICADSRTVYKGMNIGTAKPSMADQRRVPHHLLDVVDPDQNFTAIDFKKLANLAIEDISMRGKLAIMVGGSGLYIDSVLFDYGFTAPGSARDPINPRHAKKLEQPSQQVLRSNTLIIGLEIDKDILIDRIEKRINIMIEDGFIDEIKHVQAKYPDSKALLAPGYRAFAEYISGHLGIEEAKTLFAKNDYKLAKRQMTWFKRNPSINWLNKRSTQADDTIKLLNKLQ